MAKSSMTKQELEDLVGGTYLTDIAKALNLTIKDAIPSHISDQIVAVKKKMKEMGTSQASVAIEAMNGKTEEKQATPPEVEEDGNFFQLALRNEFEAAGQLGSVVGQRKVEVFQRNSTHQFAMGLSQVSQQQSEAMLKAGMAVVNQVARELPLTDIDVTPIKGAKNNFFSLTPSQLESQKLLQGS